MVLAARRTEALEALADELGQRAAAVPLDVTDSAAVARAYDAAEAAFGAPCDIIVNNAGIAVSRPVLQQTEQDWDSVLDVNLRGCFLVATGGGAAAGGGGKRGGSIVNIASIGGLRILQGVAGLRRVQGRPGPADQAMAVELARYGIRVNALCPGYVETPIEPEFFAVRGGQGAGQAGAAAPAGPAAGPDRPAAAARLRRRRVHDRRGAGGGWRPFW